MEYSEIFDIGKIVNECHYDARSLQYVVIYVYIYTQ